jgi:D-alanyl-D-alanine carboxypeptidase/D-alanyl-D-alanine-endopeptidase (penicillin-binding protein 4)
MKGLVALLLISFQAWAQDSSALIDDFKSMLPKYQVSPISEQAFCYRSEKGVGGYQLDKLQRIASVTKLITTFHASEVLDLHKTYTTKIYIGQNRLHIEGSKDPYFEEEKLLLLMQNLNDLGYSNFDEVTFDRNFLFYDIVLQSFEVITPNHTRQRLTTYLNGSNAKLIRTKWLEAYKFAKEEGVEINTLITPRIDASRVSISDINPLLGLSPVVLTHRSKPLHAILKSMNVMSKNHVAQNMYLEANNLKKLDLLMTELDIDKKSYQIYNGSGLPVKTSNSRKDNLMSCRTVLSIIDLLSESVKKQNLTVSDLVAVVGGKDLGSFRERFLIYPETSDSIMAKTGTLKHASSLAGYLLIGEKVPFAVLNHTTNISSAKKFQESFVMRLFHHLGQPTPIEYFKLSIFPWDGLSDFLQY